MCEDLKRVVWKLAIVWLSTRSKNIQVGPESLFAARNAPFARITSAQLPKKRAVKRAVKHQNPPET